MANLAQLNLRPSGRESQIRALLRDVVDYHTGVYPNIRLALAVWFAKAPEQEEHFLLELFGGIGMGAFTDPRGGIAKTKFSLLWQMGSDGPPFVSVDATSVQYFSTLMAEHPHLVGQYHRQNFEVLHFSKDLLSPGIIELFHIITEPPGLIKGWYIPGADFEKAEGNVQALLARWGHTRPSLGIVKAEESADFEHSRGILHVEVEQKWLPVSPDDVKPYLYYSDKQEGRRVYFLLEGGALYEVVRFEVKTAPDYAKTFKLLGKTPDDRYPEVHLRAVHAPAQPAA